MLCRASATFLLVALAISARAADLVGMVVRVTDGDTVTVLVDGQRVSVRLTEIDAPERGRAFGRRSGQSMAAMCLDKPARVVEAGKDQYRRTLGRVYCNGLDANAEQVRRGMTWVFDCYVTDHSLYPLQSEARTTRVGL